MNTGMKKRPNKHKYDNEYANMSPSTHILFHAFLLPFLIPCGAKGDHCSICLKEINEILKEIHEILTEITDILKEINEIL